MTKNPRSASCAQKSACQASICVPRPMTRSMAGSAGAPKVSKHSSTAPTVANCSLGSCIGAVCQRAKRHDPAMDFALTDRCNEFRERLTAFMEERVHPAEPVYEEQLRAAGDPHAQPPVMEELKEEARSRGLWNLFHPDPEFGPGLSYADRKSTRL